MLLKDFKLICQDLDDNLEIVIPYNPNFATMGGTPHIGVSNVFDGFDWDSGKLFIYPNKDITLNTSEQIESGKLKEIVIEYLWDHKDKKPNHYTKQFLKTLTYIPTWFKGF